MATLKDLPDEQALMAGVDVFAKHRDFKTAPPKEKETLEELGISATSLDVPLRAWINAKFRKPRKWPLFASGELTIGMTWSEFSTKVLTESGKTQKEDGGNT